MSETLSEPMTRREFMIAACKMLGDVLNTSLMSSSMVVIAKHLAVEEPEKTAAAIASEAGMKFFFSTGAAPQKGRATKVKKSIDTGSKEKSRRGDNTYPAFVSWFSDYIANYGKNPDIVALRAENPTIYGLKLASAYYKRLTNEQKEKFKALLKQVRAGGPEGDEKGAGHLLEALKRYDAEHPGETVGHLVGLVARAEYKTNPVQVKQEAAEARRQAGAPTPHHKGSQGAMEVDPPAAPAAAAAAAAPAAKQSGSAKKRAGAEGAKVAATEPAAAAAAAPPSTQPQGNKRKLEEATAAAAATAAAMAPTATATVVAAAAPASEKKAKKAKKAEVEAEEMAPAAAAGEDTPAAAAAEKKKKKSKDKDTQEGGAADGRDSERKKEKKEKKSKEGKEGGKDSERKKEKKDKEKSAKKDKQKKEEQ